MRGHGTYTSLSGDCTGVLATREVSLRSDFGYANVFVNMADASQNAFSYFQRTRGRIDVWLALTGSSVYRRPMLFQSEEIAINVNSVWDAGGRFTAAHEYGHAYQYGALGGLPGIDSACPSDGHYIDGAHNPACAYVEGFADFWGFKIAGPASFGAHIEYNPFFPARYGSGDRQDGHLIEGAYAAFLWDLTDPANESHDGLEVPGRYLGDIISACQLTMFQGVDRPRGSDAVIYCMEQVVDHGLYSQGYFTAHEDKNYLSVSSSVSSAHPARSALRAAWVRNLYGRTWDGRFDVIPGEGGGEEPPPCDPHDRTCVIGDP